MSMSTSVYRLPLSKLEEFDQVGVVTDGDLAALASDRHHLDQGLAYLMRDYPDVFAYMLKAEGRMAQEHEEVSIGYITPPKLRERLASFEQQDVSTIREELGEQGLPLDYLEKNIASLRSFLRSATDNGYALLVVQTF